MALVDGTYNLEAKLYYQLQNDITVTANYWTPIGSNGMPAFNGIFDGNGFTISGLRFSNNYYANVGFIGVNTGTIKNLNVEAIFESMGRVGAICSENSGLVDNCSSTGLITEGQDSQIDAGGLVGYNTGTIQYSYSTATVTAPNSNAGGLLGKNYNGAVVQYSWASGNVTGVTAGGLIGEQYNYRSTAPRTENCYSVGNVKGNNYAGGLIGISHGYYESNSNYVDFCYSHGKVEGNGSKGGLIGAIYATTVTSSYYSSTVSEQTDIDRGTPLDDNALKLQPSFVGWDFDTIWSMEDSVNGGFPYIWVIAPEDTVAVTGVSLNYSEKTMNIGDSLVLIASVIPADASNKSVIWTSSNDEIAYVNNGRVSAKTAGSATITARTADGSFAAVCEITVLPNEASEISATGVTLNRTTASLGVGSTLKLNAIIAPSNATNTNVTWTSSNAAVATVSADGTVSAIKKGNVIITVKTEDGGYTATCKVSVTAVSTTVSVTGVTLDKTSLELSVGDTDVLTATVSPDNATNKNVAWSSDDTSVATVDESGHITAVAAGTAVITVTTENNAKTATCTVTVKAVDNGNQNENGNEPQNENEPETTPYSLAASPASPQTIGTSVTLTAEGGSSYRFYYEQNGKWANIRNFSDENTCVWTPTVPADYVVYVDIQDETGKLVAIKGIHYTVDDAYSFTLDKESGQNVGVNVTLSATGGSSYKFYYEYNGAWCTITSSTTGVCEWSPKYAGNYLLYVDIKDENGKVVACRTQEFVLNDPFSLTCDAQSTELPYGNTVNFTAEGGTSYKFYYEKEGEWGRVQDFSAANTCAWTPTAVGKYNFFVDIKDASGAVVSCKRITFRITNPYSFTADKEAVQTVGTKINFTATGGNQYKFYYEKDGSWSRIQSFSTADTCAWTPTAAGRYNVYCDIADENGTVLAYKGITFVIGDVAADSYSFTTSVASPHPMNEEVTLTATGGSSYKFYYEVGGKWATIKNFSSANTATWTPDMIADYTLYVDIKNSSGTVVKTLSKQFSATDCFGFTADANASENIGKTVRFTATGGTSYKFYYQYAGAWVKVQDSASATCDWKPNKAGEYMVYVDIKNASGAVVTCRTIKLVFNDPFTFTTSASSLTQPAGAAISLSANGGTSYKFYYEKNGKWAKIQDFAAENTCTWVPSEAGKYNVYCDMKDASGAVAVCKRISFTITEKCTLAASKTSANVGESVTLVATGGASYKFYYEKDGARVRIQNFSANNTCTWKPTAAGDYVVCVDINDANGNLIGCKAVRCVVK